MKFSSVLYGRVTAFAVCLSAMGLTWDIWWHQAYGRDSFWEPPHFLVYVPVFCGLIFVISAWLQTRELQWKQLTMTFLLPLVAAPLDQIWHRIFGQEVATSIWVLFSPPHFMLVAGLFLSAYFLIPIILHDSHSDARRFITAALFAVLLNYMLIFSMYVEPLTHWEGHQVFYAGITTFAMGIILFFAERSISGFAPGTYVVIFFLVIGSMAFGENGPGIVTAKYITPMAWLNALAYLGSAVIFDLFTRVQPWIRGAAFGLFFGFVLYGFASEYLLPLYQYGYRSMAIEIGSCLIGGMIAGALFHIFQSFWPPRKIA